tara:strand:- start:445 stop:726 length:282 start_codon:yes stop_codon:yes gene_type:complete
MWLLTLKDKKMDGAYAVHDEQGDKVLFMFENQDDAERYAMMIEEDAPKSRPMDVIEIDGELAIKTCKMYNYKYAVITPDDFVIPPKDDNISRN